MFTKKYESYDVLTGPLAGKTFYPYNRPLGEPLYHPGKMAQTNGKHVELSNNSDDLDGPNRINSSDGKTTS